MEINFYIFEFILFLSFCSCNNEEICEERTIEYTSTYHIVNETNLHVTIEEKGIDSTKSFSILPNDSVVYEVTYKNFHNFFLFQSNTVLVQYGDGVSVLYDWEITDENDTLDLRSRSRYTFVSDTIIRFLITEKDYQYAIEHRLQQLHSK